MGVCVCACVSAVIGFSLPSFFGFLATRNPEGIFHVATFGQAYSLVQLASGGRWEGLPAFFEGVMSAMPAATAVDASSESVSLLSSVVGRMLHWVSVIYTQSVLFLERAAITPNLITIPDLLFVGSGYLVFVLDSCFLSLLAQLLASRLTRGDMRRLGRKLSLLLDFVTVIVILLL